MKQISVAIVVLCLCLSLSLYSWAEEYLTIMRELYQQLRTPSIPVESMILEKIAVVTYQVLLSIPYIGLQESRPQIEAVISLKDRLSIHSGMVERLLALRLQEAIDCALLHELNRRTMALRGERVNPPYQQGSSTDELLRSLFTQNALAEAEYVEYLLTRHGTFAQFCHQENLDVNAILSGKAIRAFPRDLEQYLMEILSYFRAIPEKMDEKTMQDFLFAYTLFMIDQARDIRILSEVFLTDPSFSLSMIDTRKIDKVLGSYPDYRHRVSIGEKNRGRWIFPVGSHCVGTRPNHYPKLLTDLLDPYFRDIDVITAQCEGIFSWYHQSGARPLSEFKTGMWLELKE